jgi:gluconolactonase
MGKVVMQMKVIASDLAFPEGPIVMPDGSIIVVEMRIGKITRIDLNGRKSPVAEPGGGPNGLALGPGGRIFVCNNGGVRWLERHGEYIALGHERPYYTGGRIDVIDPDTGKVERLYDQCDGRPLGAPNDLVFDADGNFWFTDPGAFRRHDKDHGALCWARADGSEIKRVVTPLERPNGVGLSPDGQYVYVADTPSGRLWCWRIRGPGEVERLPAPNAAGARMVGQTPRFGRFDSLKVSASGRILVATLADGGITEFWPDGSKVEHHPLSDTHVTNLAFGGKDMRTMYVTLSGAGVLIEQSWHEPGLKLNFN